MTTCIKSIAQCNPRRGDGAETEPNAKKWLRRCDFDRRSVQIRQTVDAILVPASELSSLLEDEPAWHLACSSFLTMDLAHQKRPLEAIRRARVRSEGTGQCSACFFRFAGKSACAAFPRGIPAAIASGRFDHTKSHPGDGGIRFLSRGEIRALNHSTGGE
jgi:hypothetical protein